MASKYDSYNPILAQWIGGGDEVLDVLDVGCSTGRLGAILKQRKCVVDGIELDPEAAAAAKTAGYRDVAVAAVEEALPARNARYDAIVFADILEHLVDPPAVLSRSIALLRPAGKIYISLPNVANWMIRAGLLAGRFEYAESGILDRTHLRFFTKATAEAMIAGAGLRVLRYRGMASRLGALAKIAPTLFAYQHVYETARNLPR